MCHVAGVQVDLAGSENIGRSGAVDRRAREAGERRCWPVGVLAFNWKQIVGDMEKWLSV